MKSRGGTLRANYARGILYEEIERREKKEREREGREKERKRRRRRRRERERDREREREKKGRRACRVRGGLARGSRITAR